MRPSSDHLIFIMGIPIMVRRYIYIEAGPWWRQWRQINLVSGQRMYLHNRRAGFLDVEVSESLRLVHRHVNLEVFDQGGRVNVNGLSVDAKCALEQLLVFKTKHAPLACRNVDLHFKWLHTSSLHHLWRLGRSHLINTAAQYSDVTSDLRRLKSSKITRNSIVWCKGWSV